MPYPSLPLPSERPAGAQPTGAARSDREFRTLTELGVFGGLRWRACVLGAGNEAGAADATIV